MPYLLLGLAGPGFLLALLLWMERIERELPTGSLGQTVLDLLGNARPEELEELIAAGLSPTVDRYWRRRRLARLLPGRSRNVEHSPLQHRGVGAPRRQGGVRGRGSGPGWAVPRRCR